MRDKQGPILRRRFDKLSLAINSELTLSTGLSFNFQKGLVTSVKSDYVHFELWSSWCTN